MKKVEKKEKLKQIQRLIDAGNTGTPQELADLLNVHKKAALRMVAELRQSDPSIRFNRIANTYERE